ncbi:Protein of unknown function [Bacillus wiedmannii]|nr:Protein of unknown function [Bacillus wiedmannii]
MHFAAFSLVGESGK